MHECIVEGSIDVGDTEDILAISNLRTEGNGGLFLWGLGLFWWLKSRLFRTIHDYPRSEAWVQGTTHG